MFQFKIPTILALILLGGIITSTVYFTNNSSILFGRTEDQSVAPYDIQIGSITESTGTVTWKTERAVANTLQYENSSNKKTAYDIRDSDRVPKSYRTHYVELTNLAPNSPVAFEIVSGNQVVYRGQFTTGPDLSAPGAVLPIYGSLPAEVKSAAFVLVSIGISAPWIVFIPQTKNWVIPLASVRTNNLQNYYCETTACNDAPITLEFITEDTAIKLSSTVQNARPFSEKKESTNETLVKGVKTQALATSPTSTSTPAATRTPSPTKTAKKWDVSIVNPKEGAALSFSKPLIRGQGVPQKEVTITISGTIKQVGKTAVTTDGTWQWTPGYPLSSGLYVLSLQTVDVQGGKSILTRKFSVLKSGEKVLSISTPSATLVPISPIPSPTIFYETPTPTTDMPDTGAFSSLFFIGGGGILLLLALTLL